MNHSLNLSFRIGLSLAQISNGRRLTSGTIAAAACLFLASTTLAANVSLMLNVFPMTAGNPNAGGTWALYASTDTPNGISGAAIYLTGINVAGVAFNPAVNADPFVATAVQVTGAVHIVYAQDIFGSFVYGIGYPTFQPGSDPLGDPTFANMTKIVSGSYNLVAPAFAQSVGHSTDVNVFRTGGPPFIGSDPATLTKSVRISLSGDYNHDGAVDAADYVLWRKLTGTSASMANDATTNVAADDYTRWQQSYGATVAGAGGSQSVPEPGVSCLLLLVFAARCRRWRR